MHGELVYLEVSALPSAPPIPLSEADIDLLERRATLARWQHGWIGRFVFDSDIQPPPVDIGARPHFYQMEREICNANTDPNCTVDNVHCYSLRYPAPDRPENDITVEDGDRSDLEVSENLPLVGPATGFILGTDPIRHEVPANQSGSLRVLRNITEEGHRFNNPNDPDGAIVERQVERLSDGRVVIRTIGAGNGNYGGFNEILGPAVYDNLDDIIEAMYDAMPMCMATPRSTRPYS